jgi:hypothetical protein
MGRRRRRAATSHGSCAPPAEALASARALHVRLLDLRLRDSQRLDGVELIGTLEDESVEEFGEVSELRPAGACESAATDVFGERRSSSPDSSSS